jgi:hypothetical protein
MTWNLVFPIVRARSPAEIWPVMKPENVVSIIELQLRAWLQTHADQNRDVSNVHWIAISVQNRTLCWPDDGERIVYSSSQSEKDRRDGPFSSHENMHAGNMKLVSGLRMISWCLRHEWLGTCSVNLPQNEQYDDEKAN